MATKRLPVLATRTLFVVAVTARKNAPTVFSCHKYTWRNYNQLIKSPSYCIFKPKHVSHQHWHQQSVLCSTDKGRELRWNDVGSVELISMINNNNVQLIDVREPYELIEDGRIENSVNIPLGEIEEALSLSSEEFNDKYGVEKPAKNDTNIVFHCRSGIRSQTALNMAYEMGYLKARHYYPGYLGWVDYHDNIQ